MSALNQAKEFIKGNWKSHIPWLLTAVMLAAASRGIDVTYGREEDSGIGGGSPVVNTVSLPEADGTRYYVIAVDPDGTASLVEIGDLPEIPQASATPSATEPSIPDYLLTPTPIVTASNTPRAPTPTQVTPAVPTVTPIPLPGCEGYPCYYSADIYYEVIRAVMLRDGPSTLAKAIRIRDIGERVFVQCIKEVTEGGSRWASEFTCDSPYKTWSAILHNGIVYMELFIKD
jgi:hypothetical protein